MLLLHTHTTTITIITILMMMLSVSMAAPKGHMKRLGSHRDSDGEIPSYDTPLGPESFWNKHIVSQKPAIFRGAAKAMPAYKLWTDEYLNEKYGEYIVRLEKKNESQVIQDVPPKAPLSTYFKDLQSTGYVVSQLPSPMQHEIMALPFMTCGPLSENIVELDFWVSNGQTHSLLHKDAFNQINCLLYGRKHWIFIDPDQIKKVPMFYENGPPAYALAGKSKIEPEEVNLLKWPKMRDVHYTTTTQNEGDCIWLPGSYLHQVAADDGRSVAASVLFGPPTSLNRFKGETIHEYNATKAGCSDEQVYSTGQKPQYKAYSDMFIAWDYDGKGPMTMGIGQPKDARNMLYEILRRSKSMTKKQFLRGYRNELNQMLGKNQMFHFDDLNSILDAMVLLWEHRRTRESFNVTSPLKKHKNVREIPHIKRDAMAETMRLGGIWFDSVAVNGKLTRSRIAALTSKELMSGLKGFFYLQAIGAASLDALGEQAATWNDNKRRRGDDDDDSFMSERDEGRGRDGGGGDDDEDAFGEWDDNDTPSPMNNDDPQYRRLMRRVRQAKQALAAAQRAMNNHVSRSSGGGGGRRQQRGEVYTPRRRSMRTRQERERDEL